jgi:hypothetical protein
MATKTAANGSVTASSTKNNGGVGKNVSGSNVLSTSALGTPDNGVFASTPIDDAGADKALSGGTFAFDGGSGAIQRVTNTLSGVSKDFLQYSAGDVANARSINKREHVRTTDLTTKIRAGKWNPTTGKFSPVLAATNDQFWSIKASGGNGALQSASSDDAAAPTRAIPGELTFQHGAASGPKSVDYSAKNG